MVHLPINAQLEFFLSGDFIARSNQVERVYRRVNPDDWDDDGIPNDEDDDPRIAADGIWYNTLRQAEDAAPDRG